MSAAGPNAGGKLIFAPGAASSSSETDPSHQAAQFQKGTLTRPDLHLSPLTQFHTWFSHPALRSSVPETCTLSTASLPSGRVSARMVYLKELDTKGWVIYSNWGTSRKAADFNTNRYVSLVFWWKDVERQVRIEGVGERLTAQESQGYYDTRARGSRVGAWASEQSKVLRPKGVTGNEGDDDDDGREELEGRVRDVEGRFAGQEQIPVPGFWGGLRVVPEVVEFWQGRESRLHDRFRYTKVEGEEGWKIERLSP